MSFFFKVKEVYKLAQTSHAYSNVRIISVNIVVPAGAVKMQERGRREEGNQEYAIHWSSGSQFIQHWGLNTRTKDPVH